VQQSVQQCVECLLAGGSLAADQTAAAVGAIMDGLCDGVDIAAFLTALAMKPLTPHELHGAALAMRQRATVIPTRRSKLLDTCGTGGDRLHTFNISTASAIVAAACGIPVAKHGNRSVSSSSGSADVLEQLGVFIGMTPQQAGACLDEISSTSWDRLQTPPVLSIRSSAPPVTPAHNSSHKHSPDSAPISALSSAAQISSTKSPSGEPRWSSKSAVTKSANSIGMLPTLVFPNAPSKNSAPSPPQTAPP
jgi:hypothetical protein